MAIKADTMTAQGSSQHETSVLITLSTPGAPTPICRVCGSDDTLAAMTVQDLVSRMVSPNSLFSIGIPMSQLEAESPTALTVTELLSADSYQVVLVGDAHEAESVVAPDATVADVAQRHTGAQGNTFLNLNLDVRPLSDAVAPEGDERRETLVPEAIEVETAAPVEQPPSIQAAPPAPAIDAEQPIETEAALPVLEIDTEEPIETEAAPPAPAIHAEAPIETEAALPSPEIDAEEPVETKAEATLSSQGIVAIVAQPPPARSRAKVTPDRKQYVRKADWLRAQFLPEVEALNFSGLFVGNLGLGIREEHTRRNVVLADPARITEVLLRGNGYRRNGDHAKALICYQELVDMDPGNADFRFLLGKTLLALGQEEEAFDTLTRAKELGHDGARKELEQFKQSGSRNRRPLGFLRFWKQ